MDYMQLNKYKMVKYLTVKNEHLSKLAIIILLILVMTRYYQDSNICYVVDILLHDYNTYIRW